MKALIRKFLALINIRTSRDWLVIDICANGKLVMHVTHVDMIERIKQGQSPTATLKVDGSELTVRFSLRQGYPV